MGLTKQNFLRAQARRARAAGQVMPIILLAAALASSVASPAQATMYKCPKGDSFEYTDRPCSNDAKAQRFVPRQPLNVVASESLTGKKPENVDRRPAWLKGPDPVGDCKQKGGKIDPELRSCVVP